MSTGLLHIWSALALAACGSEVSETSASVAAGLESERGGSREWYGNRMDIEACCLPNHACPEIVTGGTLARDDPAVWIESGGRSYVIEGAARSLSQVVEIETIWKEDATGADIRVALVHELVRSKCPSSVPEDRPLRCRES